MTSYQVRRGFEAVATVSAGTTGTAKSDARDAIRETVTDAGGDALVSVTAEAVDVYEFPSGPFDPYRVSIEGTVTVAVDADDQGSALEAGERAIEECLTAADLDVREYRGDVAIVE